MSSGQREGVEKQTAPVTMPKYVLPVLSYLNRISNMSSSVQISPYRGEVLMGQGGRLAEHLGDLLPELWLCLALTSQVVGVHRRRHQGQRASLGPRQNNLQLPAPTHAR